MNQRQFHSQYAGQTAPDTSPLLIEDQRGAQKISSRIEE